ncbi:pyridoxal-dependent decarboxylase [Phascolomyces articulosus]|uniref:ornithine decarboxylase n=1 Tax=Phascolomyces articulosus TaxID=60185 RepID=A0AAD5PJG4_9FUNG|nr:pyridoxal-dependent decarboxylase [Phascolomyces articulosus]
MLVGPAHTPILPKIASFAISAAPIEDNNRFPIKLTVNNKKKEQHIKNAIKKKLESATLSKNLGQDDCFYILDLGQLYRQHKKWQRYLPRITPYYAIKCNPDPKIIQCLASLGFGFNCISGHEIQNVLSFGVEPSSIIFAHTCKQASYLSFASNYGIRKMTFDNADELFKIKDLYPNAELLLRIWADDSKSQWGTGVKYGAPMSAIDNLLHTAKDLGLNVKGVSFHVGSGCSDISIYQDTLKNASIVFDRAKQFGFDFDLLDIGGGFNGVDAPGRPTFKQTASVIRKMTDTLFPLSVHIIAEPSRFYVAPTLTVCCQVIGRKIISNQQEDNNQGNSRQVARKHKRHMYYVNDGLHASFATRLLYQDTLNLKLLMKNGNCVYRQGIKERTYSSVVWGHTCEPGDCLTDDIELPLLNAGDWLYAENMGAYAISKSHFCGFERPKTIYVDSFTNQ